MDSWEKSVLVRRVSLSRVSCESRAAEAKRESWEKASEKEQGSSLVGCWEAST